MATKTHATWQEELAAECRKLRLPTPNFNIVSDRRGEQPLCHHVQTSDEFMEYPGLTCHYVPGGRTAWSATVTIQGQNLAARYWYDGQYINNAKEDAAEVACTKLRNPSITSSRSDSYRTPVGHSQGGWHR
ncbi:hypothetical protein PV11_01617 [Exophiala sideris]|uniref:DRBM domain-containing protein n=1 Tax=Exophiala sideris TaxID=1016849 RepID=A0A0D1XDJ0_9EURO|nr:hypothetical protein PV11_01617 [Exophiala sideris]